MAIYLRELFSVRGMKMTAITISPTITDTKGKNANLVNIAINSHINICYNGETFKISMKNQWKVVRFFNSVLQWFFNESAKDMYVIDERGKLVFNSDYKELVQSVYSGKATHQFLQARPIVVQTIDSMAEGIILNINNKETYVSLTVDEIGEIVDTINKFDPRMEVLLISNLMRMECYHMSDSNSIIDAPNVRIIKHDFSGYNKSYGTGKSPFQ